MMEIVDPGSPAVLDALSDADSPQRLARQLAGEIAAVTGAEAVGVVSFAISVEGAPVLVAVRQVAGRDPEEVPSPFDEAALAEEMGVGPAVLRAGPEDDLASWRGERAEALLSGDGGRASVVLRFAGVVIGAVFVALPAGQTFDDEQVAFLDELSGPAGDVIGRSVSAVRERRAARVISAGLLSSAHPGSAAAAGLDVRTRYVADDPDIDVGGDWFTVTGLPDGRLLMCVGDVAGHGADAVAGMAQLRYSLEALLKVDVAVEVVFDELNRIAFEERHTTATVVVAIFDPESSTLTWWSAGHLPPLIARPSGEVVYAEETNGPLLGAAARPHYPHGQTELSDGDVVVLVTDGIVEHPPASLDEGIARLRDVVKQAASSGEVDPDLLVADVAALSSGMDDAAVVVAVRRASLAEGGRG